ncbi:MAG: hypothetical protein R3A50_03615 [Saprospiraceae bacterium]
MRQTKKSISLQYALENLIAQGYQITDQTNFFQQPDSRVKSYDWRLDMVQPVQTGGQSALVIAVSSAHKSLKVAFVEYVLTITDFWPTDLLQKLFPKRKP